MSLVFIKGIPITSAATSISLTAIHARPVEDRTKFLPSRANPATMKSTSKYLEIGVSNAKPKIVRVCALITPDELLLENQGNFVRHQTTKNCAAKVATAR